MKQKIILVLAIGAAVILTGLALFLGFTGDSPNREPEKGKEIVSQEIPKTPNDYRLFQEDKPRDLENSELPTTTKTSFHFPEDWRLEVVEEEPLENFADEFYTLYSPDGVLEVNIDYKFKTDPNYNVPRNRVFPDIYNYENSDYRQIATIDGQTLVISRTGATNLFLGAQNRPVLLADSQIQSGQIYYVYQVYPEGISEYLNIFQRADVEFPSYDYNTIIYYQFSKPVSQSEWEQFYLPELAEIVSSVRV